MDSGRRDGQRCCALGFIAVDDQVDRRSADPGEEQVDQIPRRGDHGGIAAIDRIAAQLMQEAVHCRAAVARQLDPDRRCGGLDRDAIHCLIDRDDGANARAGRFDGPSGVMKRKVAVAHDHDRGGRGIGIAVRLGRVRVHQTPECKSVPSSNLLDRKSEQSQPVFESETEQIANSCKLREA
jgi:hypothetical protein